MEQQPGHQGVAAEDHGDADDVVGQARRLVFGNAHHGHQRHHHQAQAAQVLTEEGNVGRRPVEVQDGHAIRGKNAVQGVEHQPGFRHFIQCGTQIEVLPACIVQQGIAAKRQEQCDRQREDDVEPQCHRCMQLAVMLVVADVAMQRAELVEQVLAPPENQGAEQNQRQEHQRTLEQAGAEFADGHAPGHIGQLLLEMTWRCLQPFEVERLVAGNPEHLLVDGGAQAAGRTFQFLLVELEGDRLIEQRIQRAVEAVEQFTPGVELLAQCAAQFRGDLLARLVAEQVVHIAGGVADFFALLVQLELIEANVGDLVGQ